MLRLLLAVLLLIPLPVLADHVPTQPAYGQNLTTDNNAGTITIGILSSDGFEDSPPENYTIFFSGSSGITETNSFCVTTSFGHQTNTWQYYTFSNDDLKYYFAVFITFMQVHHLNLTKQIGQHLQEQTLVILM
jgi:hypothetical protein